MSVIDIAGFAVCRGQKVQGLLRVPDTEIDIPLTIVSGTNEGQTVLVLSGVHGGEYVGIETALRLARDLSPDQVKGTVIIAHPVNVPSFYARTQYVVPQDAKNLNRVFPGCKNGTTAERIAFAVSSELISKANFCLDIHGGDLHEQLVPFVFYATCGGKEVTEKARDAAAFLNMNYAFPVDFPNCTIGHAATRGIPAVLCELGQLGVWSEDEVAEYSDRVMNLLRYLGVLDGPPGYGISETMYYEKMYVVHARHSACWYPFVSAGDRVKRGQKLGELRDFFGSVLSEYICEQDSLVLYVVRSLAVTEGDPIYSLA